jgi:glucose/arabinose dehydrogenase
VNARLQRFLFALVTLPLLLVAAARTQQTGPVVPLPDPLPILGTNEQRVRISALKGFSFPWALAFLPDGDILVTERPDNPYVGKPGYQPQIYALGIRNALGLILHPRTSELMDAEHGPLNGDEVNFIEAGHNYGWPVISYGRAYGGNLTQGGSGPERAEPCAPGMDQPFLFWAPNIMPGGMTYYTGDRFPAWKDNLFISGLGSTQLHRVVFNGRGLPTRRESLLTELKQRIRDVRQGPDGLLYMVTDSADGALLRLEPVAGG